MFARLEVLQKPTGAALRVGEDLVRARRPQEAVA